MKKVMFVCHGNICRSPLAEYVFKHIVKTHNKENEYIITSRATSFEEIGNDIYPPIKRVLNANNIPLDRHYATRVKESDYDNYDLFLCMDYNNIRNISYIIKNDKDKKIHLLGEFVNISEEVEDPWYTGNYESVYKQITSYLQLLFEKLESMKG